MRLPLRAGSARPSWLHGATRRGRLDRHLPRIAGRCGSGWLGSIREVEPGQVDGGPGSAMRAPGRSRGGRPSPGRSHAGRRMEAFGRSAGSRGLRRVTLCVSHLGQGDGKICELGDEYRHRGLVLVGYRRREREQPGRGPQPVPDGCGPGDATIAATSCASVAVSRLPERPASQDVSSDVQGVGGRPGRVGSRRRIGEGAGPDRVGSSRGSITCAVPDVAAFLGAQPGTRTRVRR